MNIQIITSSFPATPTDPSGTAGLFVRAFALELLRQNHRVIVQPVARKNTYEADPGLILEPIPWQGGDQELASLNLYDPRNWPLVFQFLKTGRHNTLAIHRQYKIDKTLCMWVVPSGYFGYHIHKSTGAPYDVWALGSDIWKFKRIPLIGKFILAKIIRQSAGTFADGIQLGKDVEYISGRSCRFLASSRELPPARSIPGKFPADKKHFLFVGRYHKNKGPDILLKAVAAFPNNIKNQIHVHMFGLGPLQAHLQRMVSDHRLGEVVSLNGPIEEQELSDYLANVEFLILPSRIESIPVIFSDALQAGTPVIATPVGDIPDLISRFSCGILTDAASPDAVAQGIHTAFEKGAHPFRDGVKQACKQFSVKESVLSWLQHTHRP